MTEIAGELEGLETAWDRIASFGSRPDIGDAVGIAERLARSFQGDPIRYFVATSGNFNLPALLPDEPRARSAVIQVLTAACFYRTDGTPPVVNNDQSLPVGTNIVLTGQPTIKGFIFTAVSLTPCNLAVTYYD